MLTTAPHWIRPSRRDVEPTSAFAVPFGSARPNVVTMRADNPRLAGLGCEGNRTCSACASAQEENARYRGVSGFPLMTLAGLGDVTSDFQSVVQWGQAAINDIGDALDAVPDLGNVNAQDRASLANVIQWELTRMKSLSLGDPEAKSTRDNFVAALQSMLSGVQQNDGTAFAGYVDALVYNVSQAQARLQQANESSTASVPSVDATPVGQLDLYHGEVSAQQASANANLDYACSAAGFLDPTTGVTCANWDQMCAGRAKPTVVSAACADWKSELLKWGLIAAGVLYAGKKLL